MRGYKKIEASVWWKEGELLDSQRGEISVERINGKEKK